jgi:hypothetical protein
VEVGVGGREDRPELGDLEGEGSIGVNGRLNFWRGFRVE